METPVTVEIALTDRTHLLIPGSTVIRQANNQRWTAGCRLQSLDGSYRPTIGELIKIREDGNGAFIGSIDEPRESRIVSKSGDHGLYYDLTCIDLTSRLDQRICDIPASYSGVTCGSVVITIMDAFAPFEYIIYAATPTGFIEDGITIDADAPFVLDHQSISQAFDALAKMCGFTWRVDADGNLHFESVGSTAAPFSLTNSSNNYTRLTVGRTRENYFNVEHRKIAYEWQSPLSEPLVGDSSRRTWPLPELAGVVKSMSLNGTAVEFGTLGEGKPYSWQFGSDTITQDPGETLLTGSDTLTVEYYKLGSNYIFDQDSAAVASRSAAEGNSGIYAVVVDDSSETNGDRATAAVAADVTRGSELPIKGEFECNGYSDPISGVDSIFPRVGMVVSIVHTYPSINGDFLLQTVTAQHVPGAGFHYNATFISGTRLPNAVDFFKGLASGGSGSGVQSSGGTGGGGGGTGTNLIASYTLSADTNIVSPSAPVDGQMLVVFIDMDASPGHQITWDSAYLDAPVDINNAANARNKLTFMGNAGKWSFISSWSSN